MNASFRVSLMYLLLIIPPHGNSPLPVMESWLQKDQDDGIVQRDMTSSLTGGDESFGTAHQTYQNSLIRKKKSDNAGELLPPLDCRKYNSEVQLKNNPFLNGRYMNQDFREALAESARRSALYEDELSKKIPDIIKYRSRAPNLRLRHNDENSFNRRMLNGFSLNPSIDNYGSRPSWTMYNNAKDTLPADVLLTHSEAQEIRNMINSPMGSDFPRNQILANAELSESRKSEAKDPQIFSNDDYYDDDETNSLNGESDEDYNEVLDNHAYKHKRADAGEVANGKSSNSDNFIMDNLKYSGSDNDDIPEPLVESSGDPSIAGNGYNLDSISMNPMSDSNPLWKINSDLQSPELNNVLKNSQRALQEIRVLQQQLYNKQQEGVDSDGQKRESRFCPNGVKFDEKRLKREDEDEQKNMKTGTDEGGGGEYEDEEGKGHKDEEEYYEDADLSENDSGKDAQSDDHESGQNEKSVKRDATGGNNSKNSKVEQRIDNNQDYELNLENAPVENSEKSKKNSYREGEKTEVRKGVKIWDEWGKWSPCSATCGVGRSTRWRHCIGGGCAQGEKEAQIKRCTNPAC